MTKLSFGSDPEFMLVDQKRRYKSAIGIVNGGKENKVDLGDDVLAFYDNVLMELNIPVSWTKEGMIDSFQTAFKKASRLIYPLMIVPQASHMYPREECEHPEAKRFGCDQEFCAYQLCGLNPPECKEGNTFRSGGGHIHLGYDKEEYPLRYPVLNKDTDQQDTTKRDWGRLWVIRMMDLFIGIPALLVDHDPTSVERRKLYGKAGTHRPKEYGFEYRPLSNFWLQSPKLANLVYDLSVFAVNFVKEGNQMSLWKDETTCNYDMDEMCQIINKSDVKKAKKYMEQIIKNHLPKKLYSDIFKLSEPTRYDFYKEWNLKY